MELTIEDKISLTGLAARILVDELSTGDDCILGAFLNQVVGSCKAKGIDHFEILEAIHSSIDKKIMATGSPVPREIVEILYRRKMWGNFGEGEGEVLGDEIPF